MNIHEHQGKEVLRRYGVAVPKGKACFTADEAVAAARELGFPCVVKAQIHAGGRGKAGGVKLVKDEAAARAAAQELLGKTLVTHQTGPQGRVVRRLLVEQGCQIARELYLGMVVDRASERVTVMASTEGGVEIEEVAARTPEKILRETLDPVVGLAGFQARRIAFGLGLTKEQVGKAVGFLQALARCFVESDCSLAEINPLVVTTTGDLLALDAKIGFDDNALFRHPDLRELRDPNEQDPREIEAAKYDLSYIALDGNIGCMVNGAGLAMATMDIRQGRRRRAGQLSRRRRRRRRREGEGGLQDHPLRHRGAGDLHQHLRRHHALRRARRGRRRRRRKEVGLTVPLVVRMEGTNVEKGKEILARSGLDIIAAADMLDGCAEGRRGARGRGR